MLSNGLTGISTTIRLTSKTSLWKRSPAWISSTTPTSIRKSDLASQPLEKRDLRESSPKKWLIVTGLLSQLQFLVLLKPLSHPPVEIFYSFMKNCENKPTFFFLADKGPFYYHVSFTAWSAPRWSSVAFIWAINWRIKTKLNHHLHL